MKKLKNLSTAIVLTSLSIVLNASATDTSEIYLDYDPKKSFLQNSTIKPIFESKYITLDSKANRGNLFIAGIRVDFVHAFSDGLNFKFDGGGSFEKGNSDSLFDNSSIEPRSQLNFRKAEFSYKPISELTFKAGAISTRDFNQPILLSRGAFLGLKQEYSKKLKNFQIDLAAIQAIPNNRNYSSRLDEVNEGNPEFYYEVGSLSYEKKDTFSIKGSLGHFAFDNLSNSVADYSRYIGNSVNVYDSNKNAEFIYSYQGWTQNLDLGVYLGAGFEMDLEFNSIENTAAPEKNKGEVYTYSLKKYYGDNKYTVGLTKFRTEADATVGFYQSRAFFYVNHEGESLNLQYENLRDGFEVKMFAAQMKEIEINQLEDRDEINSFVLVLRKTYEI